MCSQREALTGDVNCPQTLERLGNSPSAVISPFSGADESLCKEALEAPPPWKQLLISGGVEAYLRDKLDQKKLWASAQGYQESWGWGAGPKMELSRSPQKMLEGIPLQICPYMVPGSPPFWQALPIHPEVIVIVFFHSPCSTAWLDGISRPTLFPLLHYPSPCRVSNVHVFLNSEEMHQNTYNAHHHLFDKITISLKSMLCTPWWGTHCPVPCCVL